MPEPSWPSQRMRYSLASRCLFFFSSRRRHTRCGRDWSSDVCSSDLVGIVNVYHEPPSFNGVDRPDVDTFVIPSTWREPGVGIFGELAEGLRYQVFFVNGFNANGFTAESALRDGHQEAQLANAGVFGGVARFDYEPILGTVFGVSAYGGTS